ncbi:MAG: FlgD immunoglobulin-like domain containing protein [Candidatus Eiseniibacteriota bacterium]
MIQVLRFNGAASPAAMIFAAAVWLSALTPAFASAQERSSEGVQFSVELQTPAVVSAKVLDLRGHLVRVLPDTDLLGPGRHLLAWDGKNDGGESAAAGCYMVRIHGGEYFRSLKLVELR